MNTATLTRVAIPALSAATPGDVELQVLEPGDSVAVLGVFDGMGPRSRELRFLVPKPRLSAAELRRFTAVDQRDHVAFLATSARDHRPIGIARFIRDRHDPESADVAVDIVDVWQNRGVGTTLLGALAQRAREVGVRRFTVVLSPGNEPALRLLHRSGGRVTRIGSDRWSTEYVVSLAEQQV